MRLDILRMLDEVAHFCEFHEMPTVATCIRELRSEVVFDLPDVEKLQPDLPVSGGPKKDGTDF